MTRLMNKIILVTLAAAAAISPARADFDYNETSRKMIRNGVQAVLTCNGLFTSDRPLDLVTTEELDPGKLPVGTAEQVRAKVNEAEAPLAACDAVVEATYTLRVQHHVCLETHGVVVDYRGGDPYRHRLRRDGT